MPDIFGTADADDLVGTDATETIDGLEGDDRIAGGLGADTLIGGGGNDTFWFNSVMSTTAVLPRGSINGGAGFDTIDFRNVSPAEVSVSSTGTLIARVGSQTYAVSNVEALLFGNGGSNLNLYGLSQRGLQVSSGNGNDLVIAESKTSVFGQGGNDVILITGWASGSGGVADGGTGIDLLEVAGAATTVDLQAGTLTYSVGSMGVSNFENVTVLYWHSGLTNTVSGDERANVLNIADDNGDGSNSVILDGRGGDDQLAGGSGRDSIKGGAGNDQLTGSLGRDILSGGDGADIFKDTAGGLDGDTITDFGAGDSIIITDAIMARFTFSLSGNTLTFTGGSLTFGTVPATPLVAVAAAGGGVQLIPFGSATADHDFNGDGRSDISLLKTDGSLVIWRANAAGGFVENTGLAANTLGSSWKIVGQGDFNGDGRDDILWRHSSGEIGEWLGQAGVFTNNGGAAANPVDSSWSVAGIADYNGDGRDDILWRHVSGEIGQWLAQANGGFANNGGAAANKVDNGWKILASGDFNGDGKADILWQHTSGVYAAWRGSTTGAMVNAGGVLTGASGSVVGSGDFNGDGRDDILFRNAASGQISEWLGQTNGQFTAVTPARQLGDPSWKIASIGDFNGDGKADLLWQHMSGTTGLWNGTATGEFDYGGAGLTMAGETMIQSPDMFWV